MKTLSILSFLFLINFSICNAQGNALNFDGIDDEVVLTHFERPDVFTMELWIRADEFSQTGTPISWGTNNISSDAYTAELTLFEFSLAYAEFDGTNFPISGFADISDGEWHHVAVTRNSEVIDNLNIYLDGTLISTSTVNVDVITDNLRLGSVLFGESPQKFFNGTIDELRIWNFEKSQTEIQNSMNHELSGNEPGLILLYNFNQGISNGDNPTVTTLIDSSPNNNTGTLTNFELSGNSSNWVGGAPICSPSFGTDTRTECNPYTWIDGMSYTSNNNSATYTLEGAAASGCDSLVTLDLTLIDFVTGTDTRTECNPYTWIDGVSYTSNNNSATFTLEGAAASGCDSLVTLDLTLVNPTIVTDTRTECDNFTWIDGVNYTSSNNVATFNAGPTVNGCDSIVTLDLIIINVSDITTSVSGGTITANNSSAEYQWLDCDNGNAIISGETSQSFTPTTTGNYAVELTENGCVETSACVSVITSGIVENSFEDALIIYPNPTNGNFSVDLGHTYEYVEIMITDIFGKTLVSKSFTQSQVLNYSLEQPSGVYFVSINSKDKKAGIRLIKK